jgi:serine/threonine protein phosphatase PrpC
VVDVRGGKNKKFKSNWVVVKAGALQYFDTDKFPQGKKPSETIGLLGVQLRQASKKECKAKTDFVFAIRYLPANKKKPEELFFAAKSGEEANLWMRAIGDSIALAAPTLFSIPLHVAIAKSGAPLPAVVLGCMNGLAQRFETDGLFRESPPPEAVMDARTNFDAGTLDVTTADAHVVLALLAMFLRELPEPLGTFGMFPFWLKMAEKDVNPRLEELPEACGSLPPANKTTLQVLLRFLGDAAEKSSATVDDVAAMFGFGTVLRPFMDDDCDAGTTAAINRLFVTMMCNWEHCFGLGDVKDPYAGETPLGGAPPAAAPAAASPAAASSVSPRTSAVATGPPSGSASPALSRASAVSPRASAVTAAAAPAGGALPTISADSPWKALKAKDGRTYYYNKETKETTWKNPLGAEPKSAWQKKETADGRVYYFNPVSKTTSWQPPAGFEEGSGGGGGGGAGAAPPTDAPPASRAAAAGAHGVPSGTEKHGVHEVKGRRVTMEDAHAVSDDLRLDYPALDAWLTGQGITANQRVSCYAVFDGHAGRRAADYLGLHFIPILVDQLLAATPENSEPVVTDNPDICTDYTGFESLHVEDELPPVAALAAAALHRAFVQVDAAMLAQHEWPDGSTGAVLLMLGPLVLAANCGDAEIVLAQEGASAECVTLKHKPNAPSERKRIQAAGGFVIFGRVGGTLAVSRAFGDRPFKSPHSQTPSDLVSVTPYISALLLTDAPRYAVVACDGLFDVFTYEDMVSKVDEVVAEDETPVAVAEAMCEAALKAGSLDNVTVIYVPLDEDSS